MKIILTEAQVHMTIKRLANQIAENHIDFSNTVIIGLQPRGVFLSDQIVKEIRKILVGQSIPYGILDITFYRDDVRNELKIPNKTHIDFSVDNKKVILIDDVLYTGRTIRAALDALQDFGRPCNIELCVLVDRRFTRQLPIQPDYSGKIIDASISEKIIVKWRIKDEQTEVVIEE